VNRLSCMRVHIRLHLSYCMGVWGLASFVGMGISGPGGGCGNASTYYVGTEVGVI
jgi:hypothetical protein